MECPQCGTENPEQARFCLNCGTKMARACPECGTELPLQARFCTACSAPVRPSPPKLAPSPGAEPALPELIADRLQRLVPKEYAERLVATRGQVSSERRTVTILFSDVKGSTAMADNLDPEDVLEVMNGAFDVLIEPVTRHEGTLARLMGDAVLAFFGAPLAHEDDPERAVRAALEIVAGAQQYAERLERERGICGFNVRVGIHTGLVVVGEVGTDLRVEYTAMGDAANLAARMEQAAPPGGILITHDTFRHIRGAFDVQPQPPLAVKGKAEPVQTYLVQRARPRAFRKPMRGVEGVETRMVGREAELKHLQEAFRTVMEDRELQVVTVTGEAGVGKSRLLFEFDLWADLLPEPFYYFQGRADPEMANLPYGLLRDLLSFRLQILDSDPSDAVREKLEEGVVQALGPGEGSLRSAQAIGRLLGFALGETHAPEDAQRVRDQALAALVGYFQGLAALAPVLVLLEDLHWADDSSLDALNHLAQALAAEPVMVVCAARPALFERRPHWGEGQPFHSRLALAPLSRHDSRRLVAEILQKVDEVPQALRDLLVGGAEGNPFFLEELIRMLVEDGVVVPGDERWTLKPARLEEVRVPPTLTGVLQARVDRLPPEERTVLQQASVVGRQFWDRAVTRLQAKAAGSEESEAAGVADRLAALRGREMIYQRETSAFAGAQEYIFQHALLREITHEGMLKRVRRVYHGLVADWLLEEVGERAGEYTELLADHLALAGRSKEAVEYLLKAGDRARGLYALKEAVRAYERAVALLRQMGDDDRAARTLMALGLTCHTAFDFRRAQQAHEEGFALWQKAGRARAAGPLRPASHALRLRWSDPPTLDPGLSHDQTSLGLVEQLFSGLVAHTPELSIVPDAAASWEILDGGCRYLFHLREDVLWSDGVPVTAHDFEYALRRALALATTTQQAAVLYDIRGAQAFHEERSPELGVRALDDATLVIELGEPAGYFLHLLASCATFPVPRHVVEAQGSSWAGPAGVVGNGPFRVAAWRPGELLVLERNPHYHGPAAGNLLQVQITLSRDPEPSAAIGEYEAGLLDVVELRHMDREQLDQARKRHAAEYVSLPSAGVYCLVFDCSRPPFDDARVRRAFALALDRETLVGFRSGQLSLPATGGILPPGMPGHVPGIALPYDPEQARQLCAAAGYPGGEGFPPVVMLGPSGAGPDVWEAMIAQWKANLGVDLRWRSMAWAEFLDTVDHDIPLIHYTGWIGDYPDPDNYLRVGLEGVPWRHEGYAEIVEQARRSWDQAQRMELYVQAQRILAEEMPIAALSYDSLHFLIKPWVKRYPVSALGGMFWKEVLLEPH